MSTILITGGTGLIGSALSHALLSKGYEVIILSRNSGKQAPTGGLSYASWDLHNYRIDEDAVKKADHIIHLAGANVAEGRWTQKRKKEIIDSRVKSGKLIVRALREIPNKIQSVISSSAIGYYGADQVIPNPEPFKETAAADSDFLANVVIQWEEAVSGVEDTGRRLVILRTRIVLSTKGGAYKEFAKPLKFGIASVLGSGNQMVSWIHIDDLVKLYIEAIEDETINGVYNAVAPAPVDNKTLIAEIARQKQKMFVSVSVPGFVLKAILGEMSIEVLKSTTVSAGKLQQRGFRFLYPTIKEAIAALTKND